MDLTLEDWEETVEYSLDDYFMDSSKTYPMGTLELDFDQEEQGGPFNPFTSNPFAYFFGGFNATPNQDAVPRTMGPQERGGGGAGGSFPVATSRSGAVKEEQPSSLSCLLPQHLQDSKVQLCVEGQPPREVRTRTPNEIRTFGVSVRVLGDHKALQATIMKVNLVYQVEDGEDDTVTGKEILGGTKTVQVAPDGMALFDNLTISETSTKHQERDFCLKFTLLRIDGHELLTKRSNPFYAYSHKKVLQRRGCVKLRTLNKGWGRVAGGEPMHIVGQPFIQGPAIEILFRTTFGDIHVRDLEIYSESVLFFTLPALNIPPGVVVPPNARIQATIVVTNDGRNFSNGLEFTYVAEV